MSPSTLDLSGRLMLVELNISVYQGKKVDQKASKEVADNHGTTVHDAGTFHKRTISKTALEPIHKIAGAARTFNYQTTLPYADAGPRILSGAGYMNWANRIRSFRESFDQAVEFYISIYPRLIEEQKRVLNGLFDENDYPTISGMREEFSFTTTATPFPSSKNWFLEEVSSEMGEIISQFEDAAEMRIANAVRETYMRVSTVVERMADRLEKYEEIPDPKSGIRRARKPDDSLVENVRDLAHILHTLNITNDPTLTSIQQRMLNNLCRHDASALQADPTFRATVAAEARAIHTDIVNMGVF